MNLGPGVGDSRNKGGMAGTANALRALLCLAMASACSPMGQASSTGPGPRIRILSVNGTLLNGLEELHFMARIDGLGSVCGPCCRLVRADVGSASEVGLRLEARVWSARTGVPRELKGGVVVGAWALRSSEQAGVCEAGAQKASDAGGDGVELTVRGEDLDVAAVVGTMDTIRPDSEAMHAVVLRLVPPPDCEDPSSGYVGLQDGSVWAVVDVWTNPREPKPGLLIHHHLGMGDHIMCYGLVRSLAREHSVVFVAVDSRYLKSFAHLFAAVKNVHPLAIDDEYALMDTPDEYWMDGGLQVLRIGYHKAETHMDMLIAANVCIAEIFYRHAGLAYSQRWELWDVERDFEREQEVLEASGVHPQAGYAFVHDDPHRGFIIDRSIIPEGLECYHPNEGNVISWNIFDYGVLMENAEELHLMDSSFALLADHLDLSRVRKKVLHVYARLNADGKPQVIGHRDLYRQKWDLLYHPQGTTHLGISIDYPGQGDVLYPSMEQPDEYADGPHERMTFTIRDTTPLPEGGARLRILEDGRALVDTRLLNGQQPYRRGECLFEIPNAGTMLPIHNRCEKDVHLGRMGFGPHNLRVELQAENGRMTHSEVSYSIVEGSGRLAVQAEQGDQQATGLLVPVSNGDALDKLSILGIKKDKILEADKLHNVMSEYTQLRGRIVASMPGILDGKLYNELTEVNRKLWEVEDGIRKREAMQDFGPAFIQLARSVYKYNDERGRIKRAINEQTGSSLVEEKMYAQY